MSVSPKRGARDIEFTMPTAYGGGKLNLMIARGKGPDGRIFRVRRAAVAAEEGQQKRLRETAVTYKDWSRGAGFGKADDDTDGGYNYGSFLYSRARGLLMPAGELTEIALDPGVVRIDSAFDLADAAWLTTLSTRMVKLIGGSTPDSLDAGVTLTAGATSMSGKVFGDRAWIANGASARIWQFDGTNWTAATDDVRRGQLATTRWQFGAQDAPNTGLIGFSQEVLVGTVDGTNTIYHCVTAPGSTASWVGPNSVGASAYTVKQLHAAGEQVYASKADGVYVVEGGGHMRNIAPHWIQNYDPDTQGHLQFYDRVLLAANLQWLDMLSPDPDQLGLMQPCHVGASESPENTPIGWRCTRMTIEGGYVLAAFWDGTYSYIFAGIRTERLGLNSRNPMTWYGAECVLPGYCTLLHVMPSRGNAPRWLIIATRPTLTSGTARLYAQSLPSEHNPYMSWKIARYPHRFAPQFTCVLSTDDLGDAGSPKNMRYVAAVTENTTNTRSLTISTTTDGGATTQQAVITEPGRSVNVFDTATADGVNVTTTLTGNSDPTQPLIVRSVKLRGTINDERTVVYEVPLMIGRDVETNRTTRDSSSPFIKRTQLYSLLEAGPITCNDWNGINRTVTIEDVDDTEILDDDGDGLTIYANVTISVLLTNATYGDSASVYGVSRYG